jgi:hypothetical protein
METTVAMNALLHRLPDLHLDPALPVEFTPARSALQTTASR